MDVIFSHVSEADRLGKSSLAELIGYLTNETEDLIRQLTASLAEVNAAILDVEEQLTDEHRKALEGHV